jgi:hypothetical protein
MHDYGVDNRGIISGRDKEFYEEYVPSKRRLKLNGPHGIMSHLCENLKSYKEIYVRQTRYFLSRVYWGPFPQL